ncbi:GNAT family N-acetyltransferase [Legionella maioricensis]|uniref:GNAT family N-acetyltransferase n=1 Tax=Legionella maioricensis TaxID=2896528 RepID=A0A9X2ICB1_9GAMM|nr:GNAT family N-acetyltransferase [Legionella maioricensis]MCL9683573.1 GNAT family N-acetyltransferase [Legionella maioricensis]MCL9686872.1 GNAT family N-acetyltransferase [Legionella maioricensis]
MRASTWSNELIQLFVLTENDVAPSYIDWLNDPEVNRYLESRFEIHSLESTRQFVKNCMANDNTLLLGIRFPLLENKHIGNIKLEINQRHGLGEVGIMIGEKKAHGKGVATQAISLLAQIARDELKLRKLTAGCYESNKASERAFIKAGFVIEGKRPEHFLINGQPEDLTLMGMML